MDHNKYQRIRDSIIRSGYYTMCNGFVVQDGHILTPCMGFMDYFSYKELLRSGG